MTNQQQPDLDLVDGKPVRASGAPQPGPSGQTAMDAAIARQVAAKKAARPPARFGDKKADPNWPIDVTAAIVDRHEAPTQNGTRDALAALEKSYVALAETFNTVTPEQRAAWHGKAEPASTSAVRAASRQLQNIESALVLYDAAITEELKDKKTLAFAAEIRSVIRAERVPLSQLMHADYATVSAVLSAPPRLSGLTQTEHDQLREIAAKVFAPEQYQRREAAKVHYAKLTRALQIYTERVGDLLGIANPKALNDTLARIG